MGKVIETVADSIAIEILDESVIVIGKGNELHLYKKNVSKEKVFDTEELPVKLENKIHGITKSTNSCILLVHGEKEFLLLGYNSNYQFHEIYRTKLSDWISCGLILSEHDEIVLLTAHSIILRFSYNVDHCHCNLKERISCTDKSTLYCAHLFGYNWNELVVLSGNAFGELLIWQPAKNYYNQNDPPKPKVSPLLHRISAHNGVVFSIHYNQESQYLVTTSDDRSIKWWKVEFTSNGSWSGSNLQALSSGYGHVARVFKGRIINEGDNVYALTVSEDSFFCIWNKNSELIFKRRQQYGAIIWNFVYDHNTKTIYTTGSTGNLVAFGLNQILEETKKYDAILLNAQNSTEYIAKLKFLNENHLIGVSNKNNLMSAKFNGEDWLSWQSLQIETGFKCTVLELYENIIAICGYKRLLLLEHQENNGTFKLLHDEEVLKSVIRTFVFFNNHQYLLCDDTGSCLILMNSFNNKLYLELPKCKEPWLTTALLLNQQRHIAASNRQGNLLLYQLRPENNHYELKHTIKHPHGHLGSTYLNCVEENSTSALIWSAGHDRALNVFSVDFLNNVMQTCTRQIIPVAWVEYVEKLHKDIQLFLGFNDNHFVVWCKNYDFLLQIPCGGGHRCWSFAINQKNGTISLAFIKNKRVHFNKMPLLNKELATMPLAKRWHIAPCNTMEILCQSSSYPYIAVSAGDDNLLKIHAFSHQTGLKEIEELHSHISSIRCIKLILLNENEFLLFSGGGRAQLCVNKINYSNFRVNELLNYTLKIEKHENKSNPYNFDPETRLMSLDIKVINEEEYEIYVGCSDGFIKRLKLNLKKNQILLLAQYFYNKCVLQIRYLVDTDMVLVAGTDGVLRFFNSALLQCFKQLQHHASGINALSILYDISNRSLHILSGGDDQAVAYTQLSLQDLNFKVIRQFHKPYLHTSQVSACALSTNGMYGFTSGLDQVLNKIDLNTGDIVDSFYSCVADIKGVAVVDDNVCLLYGCGLQIYAFNS